MTSHKEKLRMPPVQRTSEGEERCVGVELEMGGVDLDTVSSLVARHFHGQVEKTSAYEHFVHGDPAGRWGVELDFAWLKEKGRKEGEPDGFLDELEDAAEELIRKGAEQIVPVEVVGPPLPLGRLGEIEDIIAELRAAGARGTTDEMIYAFGMQFNPELPRLDAATVTSYLKSFLCLFPWLKDRADVDFTRRLTAYVDPYPREYVRKVVDPAYAPEMDVLIDDYLADNPTRNRALDMLPLFTHLDEERVRRVVSDELVKARPTLHYRLPNCEIDRETWGLHSAWNDWIAVEVVAADGDKLADLCRLYAAFLDAPVQNLFEDWAAQVASWLDHCSAR